MGPILRAEVGDIIQVFFWNRATKNYTIHPHVRYGNSTLFSYIDMVYRVYFMNLKWKVLFLKVPMKKAV